MNATPLPEASHQDLIEVCVPNLNVETAPSVIELLERWGRGGAVVEQLAGPTGDLMTSIKVYLSDEDHDELRQIEIGLALLNRVSPAQEFEPHTRLLAKTDWAEAWKAHYHVLHVGRRLVVRPSWCDDTSLPHELILELDPGMAFGSGLHPTTQLCLRALEDIVRPGATVLDVGTGSGILAIAAGRLGAARVLALDTDPLAVQVARQNVALNRLEPVIAVQEGTLEIPQVDPRGDGQAGWEVIIANILAETIVQLAAAFQANLAPAGVLIASGIIADRADEVIASLHRHQLTLLERESDGDWVALTARR
jgi:ribosomal protein L11 methyltransferase